MDKNTAMAGNNISPMKSLLLYFKQNKPIWHTQNIDYFEFVLTKNNWAHFIDLIQHKRS